MDQLITSFAGKSIEEPIDKKTRSKVGSSQWQFHQFPLQIESRFYGVFFGSFHYELPSSVQVPISAQLELRLVLILHDPAGRPPTHPTVKV